MNHNNITNCCVECIISKLVGANYYKDYPNMKIMLDILYQRFLNKTHKDDHTILDIQINNTNLYKIYNIKTINGINMTLQIPS